MTVAELAKRFETARVEQPASHVPNQTPARGRVKELTRRLEEAVIDTGTSGTGFGAQPQSSDNQSSSLSPTHEANNSEEVAKLASPQPISSASASSEPASSEPAHPSTRRESSTANFPSPPPLPRRVSQIPSNNNLFPSLLNPAHTSPSTRLSKTKADIASIEQLPSASKVIDASETILSPPPANAAHDTQDTPPADLSLSERLAAYEQLTNAAPSIPDPKPISMTPSTAFSSHSSDFSSQRDGPIELIPDVSEGDLDDIEGVERVDDETSMTSSPEEDENATFRRSATVQTLPSTESYASHQSCEELIDPPSNPATPSNASRNSNASENSSFSSADYASATEEFHGDRPVPHTVAVPMRAASRHSRQVSNLSAQPHTLHIAPGSFKRLPKAKVVIARRRGNDEERQELGNSSEDPQTKKLIREYEHPKELLEGTVSLVELSDEEDFGKIEFRDPEISDARKDIFTTHKKNRVEAYRHRYDEFMDPQEIERANDVPLEEESPSSKQRYQRRRLFRRGKVEKARQREERLARQREAAAKRSTVISGAIDRVSLAADPWIDFITDNNTIPVGNTGGGGIRRGLKRLFGLGRHNAGLIKSGE